MRVLLVIFGLAAMASAAPKQSRDLGSTLDELLEIANFDALVAKTNELLAAGDQNMCAMWNFLSPMENNFYILISGLRENEDYIAMEAYLQAGGVDTQAITDLINGLMGWTRSARNACTPEQGDEPDLEALLQNFEGIVDTDAVITWLLIEIQSNPDLIQLIEDVAGESHTFHVVVYILESAFYNEVLTTLMEDGLITQEDLDALSALLLQLLGWELP